jgi:inner membrane protein
LDNLTHSLFAMTLARTPLSRAGRGTTVALLLASNAPDIDIVATAGGAANYLAWHRGLTHGPLGIFGLAVVSAGLVWLGRRQLDRRNSGPNPNPGAAGATTPDASFAMLVAVSVVGVLLHVLMDLPTSYGIRLLAPFTWRWFAVDWMPIIDIYLVIALVAGLAFGQRSPEARRRNAVIVLLLMAVNYGIRGVSHHQALEAIPRVFGPTLPQRCDPAFPSGDALDSWPRPAPAAIPASGRRCLVDVAAMPSFTSPFRWRVIVQVSNGYETRDVDLLDPRLRADSPAASEAPWRTTTRYPNVWTPAAARAATTRLGQIFLGFSRFPAARSLTDESGVTSVRFIDMRFSAGPVTVDQPVSRATLFTASVRIGADGAILQESLGR